MRNGNGTWFSGWVFWTALMVVLTGCDGWGGHTKAQSRMSSPEPSQVQREPSDTPFPLKKIVQEVAAYLERLPGNQAAACFYGPTPKWLRPSVFWKLSPGKQGELESLGFRLTVQKHPELQAGLIPLENRFRAYLMSVHSQRSQMQAVAKQSQEFLNSLSPAEKRLWDAYVSYFFEPKGGIPGNYRTLRPTKAGLQSLAPLADISETVRGELQKMNEAPSLPPIGPSSPVPLFVVSPTEMPVVYRTIQVRSQDVPRVLRELQQSSPERKGKSPDGSASGNSPDYSLAWVAPICNNCFSPDDCLSIASSGQGSGQPNGSNHSGIRNCIFGPGCAQSDCYIGNLVFICSGKCLTEYTSVEIVEE